MTASNWIGAILLSALLVICGCGRKGAGVVSEASTNVASTGGEVRDPPAPTITEPVVTNAPFPPPTSNLVWVVPGTFVMGSPTTEAERERARLEDEAQHTVTLTKGFYTAKYLVTQNEYAAVVDPVSEQRLHPSLSVGHRTFVENAREPKEGVSWTDATNYCSLLTQQELQAGRLPKGWAYRLPTEAEWEYACRAGTTTAFYFGDALHSDAGLATFRYPEEYDAAKGTAWNRAAADTESATLVGSHPPNPWGLYDMCGNLDEWCQDYRPSYGAIVRGGNYMSPASACRSASRNRYPIESGGYGLFGIRVVLAATGE